ncbi:anthrax toxin lethal factor-related metalloendopeptidase [Fuchsiella alkaliacetigena]|uniref:anthrax toxin lethal factor-related metalloendopeptidase n=1 Tax=Fuchsiella alkaliacetigena TaxID=957042 RepID=UPI00200B6FE9|nr:hypothetical protein [Fuchsiella alkaliacetigena]MCK8826048.1 hypothetical protein [Fuchsiella alkaliacetigena]
MQSKNKISKTKLSLIMVLIICFTMLSVTFSKASATEVVLDYGIHYFTEEEILAFLAEDRQQLDSERMKIAREIVEIPDTEYDQAEVERMLARVANMDLYLLERLKNSSTNIYFTQRRITDFPAYSHLRGVTPRGWEGTGRTWDDIPGVGGNPVIVRIGHSDPGNLHGTVNLELHEIGHLVDLNIFRGLSNTSQFQEIWRKERYNLFNDPYFIDYSDEYFAEAFALYYLSEESRLEVKEKTPLTYNFFKEHFSG